MSPFDLNPVKAAELSTQSDVSLLMESSFFLSGSIDSVFTP